MENDKLVFVRREISKCSNCGLCLSSCSAYQTTKNETFSPRAILNITRYELANNLPFSRYNGCGDGCTCILKNDFEKICPTGIDLARLCSNLT